MHTPDRFRAELGAAASGPGGPAAIADRLCDVCAELLEVDGASISLTVGGLHRGTLGASGVMSRRLDELQFTFGEGPCLDAAATNAPVIIGDLTDPSHTRWPVLTGAVLEAGVKALFALPVRLSSQPVGALDLFRTRSGPLPEASLAAGLWAAELAALPLLDLLAHHDQWEAEGQPEDGWHRLASLESVEVYQATGMLMAAFDVDPGEALVRLRAQAFFRGMTSSQLALAIVERDVLLTEPEWSDTDDGRPDGRGEGA